MTKSDQNQPQNQAPKVIMNTRKRHVLKGNQYRSGGWVGSPAMLEIFAASDWALTEIAQKRGLDITTVDKVRLARVEGEQRIYILPTNPNDPEGIEVNRSDEKAYINMIEFLVGDDQDLRIETGYKERYELPVKDPKESPVGWALCLDLSKPLERKLQPKTRKKATQAAQAPQTPQATPAATTPATE